MTDAMDAVDRIKVHALLVCNLFSTGRRLTLRLNRMKVSCLFGDEKSICLSDFINNKKTFINNVYEGLRIIILVWFTHICVLLLFC